MALNVEYQWIDSHSGLPVDNVTAAEIGIQINGMSLSFTDDIRTRTTRNTIRVSGYRLASWIVDNWWRLRYEAEHDTIDWRLAHEMPAAGGGFAWPPISLHGDVDVVRWIVGDSDEDSVLPVHYSRPRAVEVSGYDHEEGLSRFVSAVVDRLHEYSAHPDIAEPYRRLATVRHEVERERADSTERAWRRMEAMLGYDPDVAESDQVESLVHMSNQYGEKAIAEVASYLQAGAEEATRQFLDAASSVTDTMDLSILNATRTSFQQSHPAAPTRAAWQLAEEQAALVRTVMGITHGRVSTRRLTEPFSVSASVVEQAERTPEIQFSGALSSESDSQVTPVLPATRLTGRRFSLGRLIGDRIYSTKHDRILPITNTYTRRQQFQRAFSQSLLCPSDELMDYVGNQRNRIDTELMERAAEHFQVSPLMVQSILINKHVIERPLMYELVP